MRFDQRIRNIIDRQTCAANRPDFNCHPARSLNGPLAAILVIVTIPDRIPIKREPGYRTNWIGRYADGFFFGDVTGAFAELAVNIADDWQRHKRCYAVLHRFDHDGNHIKTDTWLAGTTADGERIVGPAAERMLETWLEQLDGLEYGDIAIRLFRVVVDDVVFGLIDESDEDGEHVELRPQDLGFYPPWDGEYDT